ncbi:unnamed protein product [Caenorhabditis auriculariae]|uniref:BZIP domain-containing protein n=1 Tax=Caenorhabditis auriculariae TaxID=2777116 RepID=A0A8S1GX39_9PELO|nr:unnamed protein product [Caenorhabditis auriculariae]
MTMPPAASTTPGGFLGWPPSPPIPPPDRAPASHAFQDQARRRFLQALGNNVTGDTKKRRRIHDYTDCELILVLDSKKTSTTPEQTYTVTSTTTTTQIHEISTYFDEMTDDSLSPTSSCDMNAYRDLNEPMSSSLLLTEDFEAEIGQTAHYGLYNDYPTTYDFPTDANAYLPAPCGQPEDAFDLDSLMNCDITSLDAYIHYEAIEVAECVEVQQTYTELGPSTSTWQPPVASPVDIDPVEEFFPNLGSDYQGSTRSRKSSKSTASPELSDYRVKRDKNNIASQRSRQKRQQLIRETKEEKDRLEKRNVELKTLLDTLQNQVDDYKSMVLMVVAKRGE